MTTIDRLIVWQSPSGRLHKRQRCSGNGQSRNTHKIAITVADLDAARADRKVCRCLAWTVAQLGEATR